MSWDLLNSNIKYGAAENTILHCILIVCPENNRLIFFYCTASMSYEISSTAALVIIAFVTI